MKLSKKIADLLMKAEYYYNIDCDEKCEGDYIALTISYHGDDDFICELRRPTNSNCCDPDLRMVAPNLGTDHSRPLIECLNELNELLDENRDNCNVNTKEEDILVVNGKEYKFTGNYK